MSEIVVSKSGVGRTPRREVLIRKDSIGCFSILDRKSGVIIFGGFTTAEDARSWVQTVGTWREVSDVRDHLTGKKEVHLAQ